MRYRLVPAARVLQPVLAGRVGPVPGGPFPGTPIRGADATVQGGVLVADVVPCRRVIVFGGGSATSASVAATATATGTVLEETPAEEQLGQRVQFCADQRGSFGVFRFGVLVVVRADRAASEQHPLAGR